jgi:hypothetical protein
MGGKERRLGYEPSPGSHHVKDIRALLLVSIWRIAALCQARI